VSDRAPASGADKAGGDKPKIGFNLLWLVPGVVGGTEEATVELLRTLADEPPDDIEYRLYALEPFASAHPQLVERFPTQLLRMRGKLKPLRVLAEGTWLTRTTRRDGVRLVHHAGGTLPPGSHLPSVVTIHDLQPFDLPENFHPAKRAYLHQVVPRAVRQSKLVLVHSEFVRRSVMDRFGIGPDRVRVILAGVRPHPPVTVSREDVRRRYDLPEHWFVYPAITYPHKNHVTLVRAFARVASTRRDVALVLTGRPAGEEARLLHEIERLHLSDQVRRTGRVPRADLMGLIAGSTGLAFPSRYEGFGLPVLEAMALGAPVLASSTTALPEVVGGAGLLADPDDVGAWSTAMLELLDDEERARWVKAGRERAAELSWSAAAASTASAHRAVLATL
jgi:glycosyltransferase involved in cell wall biosynthesis